MNWLEQTITNPSVVQTIILIAAISALGLKLGKIKIFNISLGITFVFFVGIFIGHFQIPFNRDMLAFAQNFGLILFIYALGLQVGPGFFPSLKKGGIGLNSLALAVIIIGTAMAIVMSYISRVSIADMMGVLSGATTNTPALGAAQQTLKQVDPSDTKTFSDMALACAVTYPLGVIGVILAIVAMRLMIQKRKGNVVSAEKRDKSTYVGEFTITNPGIIGKTIKEIMKLTDRKFVISRIWRDGKVTIPTSECTLQQNDHILVISVKTDVDNIKALMGEQENTDWNEEDIDWNHIDNGGLVSRNIIITRSKINGVKLGTLKLRNLYGINITRIDRAGIDLLASPNLSLQIGDKLTVVGEKAAINNVSKILGNELKRLKNPNLIAIFMGIALGLILGSIPISIPGISVPVKLGIAGGPIIVGILMGAFGARLHIATYTTQSANLMLRQLGLVIYLACLGLDSGAHFLETVVKGDGMLWIIFGFMITIIPVFIVGFIAMYFYKVKYNKAVGMLCGSMANPIALDYVNSTVDGDEPSVAYATVYPVSMFARIIIAQMVILIFT